LLPAVGVEQCQTQQNTTPKHTHTHTHAKPSPEHCAYAALLVAGCGFNQATKSSRSTPHTTLSLPLFNAYKNVLSGFVGRAKK